MTFGGGLIMFVAVLAWFMNTPDHFNKWGYYLGTTMFGLMLIILDRLLPDRRQPSDEEEETNEHNG